MPDIREILSALDIDDRALWSEQRTTMRRSYLNAHNQTVGIGSWSHEDDAFMDLIDIRLALLFDRAGRLNATHDIVGNGHKIENDLKASEDKMKNDWRSINIEGNATGKAITEALEKDKVNLSEATKMLQQGFSNASTGWGQPK